MEEDSELIVDELADAEFARHEIETTLQRYIEALELFGENQVSKLDLFTTKILNLEDHVSGGNKIHSVQDICQEECHIDNNTYVEHCELVDEENMLQLNTHDLLTAESFKNALHSSSNNNLPYGIANIWAVEESEVNEEHKVGKVKSSMKETSQSHSTIETNTEATNVSATSAVLHSELKRIKCKILQLRISNHKMTPPSLLHLKTPFEIQMSNSNRTIDVRYNCLSELEALKEDLNAQLTRINGTINMWAEASLNINNEIETIKTSLFMLRVDAAKSRRDVNTMSISQANSMSHESSKKGTKIIQESSAMELKVKDSQEKEDNVEPQYFLSQLYANDSSRFCIENDLKSILESREMCEADTIHCVPRRKVKTLFGVLPSAPSLSHTSIKQENKIVDEESTSFDKISHSQLVTNMKSCSDHELEDGDTLGWQPVELESLNTNILPTVKYFQGDSELPLKKTCFSHNMTNIIQSERHLFSDDYTEEEDTPKRDQADFLKITEQSLPTDIKDNTHFPQNSVMKCNESTEYIDNQNDNLFGLEYSMEKAFEYNNLSSNDIKCIWEDGNKLRPNYHDWYPQNVNSVLETSFSDYNDVIPTETEDDKVNLEECSSIQSQQKLITLKNIQTRVKTNEMRKNSAKRYQVQIHNFVFNSQQVILNSEDTAMVIDKDIMEVNVVHHLELLIEVSKISSDMEFILQLESHEDAKKVTKTNNATPPEETGQTIVNKNLRVDHLSPESKRKKDFDETMFVTLYEAIPRNCCKRTGNTYDRINYQQSDEQVSEEKCYLVSQPEICLDSSWANMEAYNPSAEDTKIALPLLTLSPSTAAPPVLQEAAMSSIVVTLLGKINKESLLIGWETAGSEHISAFEVLVNGKRKQVIYNKKKGTTIINSLDLSQSFIVTLYALGSENKRRAIGTAHFHPN